MIPIPFPMYKAMALQLRLLDAKVAAAWSSLLGVPVLQDGYLLHLPRITLEVADGCSGTLSLLALVALGTFYISEKEMAVNRKAALWMMLIPVSVLANIIRIVLIVVLVHYSGNWILETTFHKLVGTFNFALGFGVILLLGSLLGRAASARDGRG
jgi:exosortase